MFSSCFLPFETSVLQTLSLTFLSFQVLSFCLFISMIVTAVEIGAMERDAAKTLWLLSDMEDIEIDARLSGLYAMSIILVFMFLAKFLFDVLFIYGVYTVRYIFVICGSILL